MTKLEEEIRAAINSTSGENESNTPDFVLARFLAACLDAFNVGIRDRDDWYGVAMIPGLGRSKPPSEFPPVKCDACGNEVGDTYIVRYVSRAMVEGAIIQSTTLTQTIYCDERCELDDNTRTNTNKPQGG